MWEDFLKKHNIHGSEKQRFYDEMRWFEICWIKNHPECVYDGIIPPELKKKKERKRAKAINKFLIFNHQLMSFEKIDAILNRRYGEAFQSEVMREVSDNFIGDPYSNKKEMDYIVKEVDRLSKTLGKEEMRRFLLSLEPGVLMEKDIERKYPKGIERKYAKDIERKYIEKYEKKYEKDIEKIQKEIEALKGKRGPLDQERRKGHKRPYETQATSGGKWEKFREDLNPTEHNVPPSKPSSSEPSPKRSRKESSGQDADSRRAHSTRSRR